LIIKVSDEEIESVSVFDTFGKASPIQWHYVNNKREVQIIVSKLSPGIYFVRAGSTDGITSSGKFIKE